MKLLDRAHEKVVSVGRSCWQTRIKPKGANGNANSLAEKEGESDGEKESREKGAYEPLPSLLRREADELGLAEEEAEHVRHNVVANHEQRRQQKPHEARVPFFLYNVKDQMRVNYRKIKQHKHMAKLPTGSG